MIHLYNTQLRRKQAFAPLDPSLVRMYVCGMTVYDLCHVGHARVMIVFDTVARYLRFSGYPLRYIRNITDIDDKIIARAHERQEDWRILTQRYINAMHEDAQALRVLDPDLEPKATDYIPQILDFNQRLVDAHHAYATTSGDVYFAVRSFAGYGRLGGRHLEELLVGARVEPGDSKQDPLDFALWKAAKPAEPSWCSPWGHGRPGWHIECSAMSMACLGEQLDIHGGGGDLVFPHHENEIAQSEAVTGKTFAQNWMHVGFVQVNAEKMSKSLGNFFTIREVLQRYRPEVLRYFIIASHYRSPLNYSDENLELARTALERFYQTLQEAGVVAVEEVDTFVPDRDNFWVQSFCAAMDDDFNTPEALSVLFALMHTINRMLKEDLQIELKSLAVLLRYLGGLLGILHDNCVDFLRSGGRVLQGALSDQEVDSWIAERNQAKSTKDFQRADQIRLQLLEQGIILEDNRQGTRWRRS